MLLKKIREFLDRRERIFIIPTSYGLYYLSIIFILFLISLSYGHSLAFSTTFIFVSIILVSAYYTNYNLSGLTVSKVIQKYESSDLKFKTYIQIKNDANKVRFDIEGKVLNLSSLKSTTIKQRDTDSIYIDFSQLKPGLYHLDKVRINTSFPFGLFRSWKNFKTDAEIIVLPSISNSVAMINTFTNSLNSKKEEVKREGVDDFEGHSAYRFGDSWKNIDWKAYSRQHGLVKKEYTENFKSELTLNLDQIKESPDLKMGTLLYHLHELKDGSSLLKVILNNSKYIFNYNTKNQNEALIKTIFYKLYAHSSSHKVSH